MIRALTQVIRHIPMGYVRTKLLNAHPALGDLAFRCLEPLLDGELRPTCREVAERFRVNKDTASKALRQLVTYGYLLYKRRSAGNRRWVHIYLVTDEPWAWRIDDDLAARFEATLNAALDRAAELSTADQTSYNGVITQVESCPEPSDPTEPDGTNLFIPRGGNTPKAPSVDRSVHRRAPRDYTHRVARALGRIPAPLQAHTHRALALLEALGFPPMLRVRYLPVIASALNSGAEMGALQKRLTKDLDSARNVQATIGWRIHTQLADELTKAGQLIT